MTSKRRNRLAEMQGIAGNGQQLEAACYIGLHFICDFTTETSKKLSQGIPYPAQPQASNAGMLWTHVIEI